MKLAWILHGAVALLLSALLANCLATPPMERDKMLSELDKLVEEDGSIETALMNYLFAKQVANRFKSQMDMTDLQRKRSYWKQCAFNAVSCFGQKREGGGGSLGRGGGPIISDKNPARWNFFKNLFRFYD